MAGLTGRFRRSVGVLGALGAIGVALLGQAGAITRQPAAEPPQLSPCIEAPTTQSLPRAREPMNNARLSVLLRELDPDLTGVAGNWVVRFQDTPAQILTDEAADRMRIMLPIDDATKLEADALYRMLQANFESALDARYAIAQGMVWVTFIHPLSPLTPEELSLALAQTYNAAITYGESYSGGLFQFGGGDHRNEIFDEIINKGTPL